MTESEKVGDYMLSQERRQLILDYINKNGSAGVTELSEMFDASESTVRRD